MQKSHTGVLYGEDIDGTWIPRAPGGRYQTFIVQHGHHGLKRRISFAQQLPHFGRLFSAVEWGVR